MKMRKTIRSTNLFQVVTAVLVFSFTLVTPKANATFLNAGTEVTQVAHTGINTGGWLNDAYNWAQQRVDELNKITQLITNNVFTEAIRGFNELMTAIQTDISQVLGTVATLMDAPINMFRQLIGLPMSVMGQITGALSPFQNLYNSAMSMFGVIGNAQGLGSIADVNSLTGLFGGSGVNGFSSAFDFNTKVNGLVTKVNSDFLDPAKAQRRSDLYREWTTQGQANLFGGDAIQIQAMQSRQLTHISEALNRQQEAEALMNLRATAKDLMAFEQAKARSAGTYNRAAVHISSSLGGGY
jgi:hypothetical protein